MKNERETYCMNCYKAFTKERPIGAFKAQKNLQGKMQTGWLCIACSGGSIVKPTKIAVWNQEHPTQENQPPLNQKTSLTPKKTNITWNDLIERLELKKRRRS